MANNVDTNPMIIDTASANAIVTRGLYVTSIEWDAESAVAGNNVIIQDKLGRRKWGSTASGANYKEEVHYSDNGGYGRFYDGLLVPTLDAGTIYIYTSIRN